MRELVFALEFTGSAGPAPGRVGRRRATTSATSQVFRTILAADGIHASIEPLEGGLARLESEVQATGEGRFIEWGTIAYGEAGTITFRTVGEGTTGPSPVAGVRHGAVIWEITGGDGRLAGARGLITSSFTVGADGRVTDDHAVRMFLPAFGSGTNDRGPVDSPTKSHRPS
jgi:hypothetical protein